MSLLFSKGMNLENSHGFLEDGEYTESLNIVSDRFGRRNIYGTTDFSDFASKKPTGVIIGDFATHDTIYLLVFNSDDSSGEVGKIVAGIYSTIINDLDVTYWQDVALIGTDTTLGFTANELADLVIKVIAGEVFIYWTSDTNPPRYLNTSIDYTLVENRFVDMSKETSLFSKVDTTVCRYKETINGGSLKAGSYQFATRYITRSNVKTAVGLVCNIIPVTKTLRETTTLRKDYVGANYDEPVVNKSISLDVLNIDYTYKYLELIAIYYTEANSEPKFLVFDRFEINRSLDGAYTPTYNLNKTFNGSYLYEISKEEFSEQQIGYERAENISTDGNRLYLSNLKQLKEVNAQVLIANKLRLKYVIEEVLYNEATITDYADEAYTFAKKGYRRGEAYSFGIRIEYVNGKTEFVNHIPAYFGKGDGTFYPHETGDGGKVLADTGTGQLGTYFSNHNYSVNDYYFDSANVDMVGTNIRHHLMPTTKQEPHYRIDAITGDVYIRILGIKIDNFSTIIAASGLQDKIKAIHIVRERRNTYGKKSLYAQGFCNTLLYHDGKMKGGQSYRQGNALTIDYNIPPKRNDYRNKVEYLPTFSINPFMGVTHIMDYNSGTFPLGKIRYAKYDFVEDFLTALGYLEAGRNVDGSGNSGMSEGKNMNEGDPLAPTNATFPDFMNYSGVSLYTEAKKNVFFYSPEAVLIDKSWNPPTSSNVVALMLITTKPVVVLNYDKSYYTQRRGGVAGGLLPNNILLTAGDIHHGSYSDDYQFPFVRSFRAPYYHVHAKYGDIVDIYDQTNVEQILSILGLEYTKNNNTVRSNEDILNLNTFVGKTTTRLNNYDNEGGLLLNLSNVIDSNYKYTAPMMVILGGTTRVTTNEIHQNDCWGSYDNAVSYQRESAMNALLSREFVASGIEKVVTEEPFISVQNPIDRMLYNLDSLNETQYGLLDSSEYIDVATFVDERQKIKSDGELKWFMEVDSETLFNGDTFIGYFWYRNSFRQYYRFAFYNGQDTILEENDGDTDAGSQVFGGFGRIKSNEGAEMRLSNYVLLESEINCNYRHRIVQRDENGNITGKGAPFYPNSTHVEALDPESEQCQEYGYNIQYSFENDIRVSYLKPYNFKAVENQTNLIIASEPVLDNDTSNQFIIFKPNTFIVVGQDTGSITGMRCSNNSVYVWTPSALYNVVTQVQQQVQGQGTEISLGMSKMFSTPARRLTLINNSSGGCIDKRTIVSTDTGIYYLDAINKQVLVIADGLKCVTEDKIKTWFRDNLIEGVSHIAGYDKKNNLYYLTHLGESDNYETIALDVHSKYWVSFMSYSFRRYISLNTECVGITGNELFLIDNDKNLPLNVAGTEKNAYISTVIANNKHIKFHSINVDAKFYDTTTKVNDYTKFFNKIDVENETQFGTKDLVCTPANNAITNRFLYNVIYANKQFQVKLPLDAVKSIGADINNPANQSLLARRVNKIQGKYLKLKLYFDAEGKYNFSISSLNINIKNE